MKDYMFWFINLIFETHLDGFWGILDEVSVVLCLLSPCFKPIEGLGMHVLSGHPVWG